MSGKVNAAALRTSEEGNGKAAQDIIANESMSKSAKIRALFALTGDRSTVANLLGIRYQHVRNVLITPLKEVVTEEATAESE